MSRSFKKTPICKCGYADAKKFANRRVRKQKHVGNYGAYKKVYPQYDINEFIYYYPLSEFKADVIEYELDVLNGLQTFRRPTINKWKKYQYWK